MKSVQKSLDEVICAYIDSNPEEDDYLSISVRDLMEWARREARSGMEADQDKDVRLHLM